MGDEFGAMFERVLQQRVDEARKEREAADEARAQARRDFDTKAACLTNVVLPTLEEAKAGFANRGLEVHVATNTTAAHVATHVDPIVRFSFAKPQGSTLGINVDSSVIYAFTVTHTQGGVRVHRESKNHHQTTNSSDLSKQFGVGVADQLTREKVLQVIESAFRDATR